MRSAPDSPRDSHTRERSANLRGILSMLAAVGCFSLMDASMKQLVGSYPPMQVAFIRGAASLPCVLAITWMLGKWKELRPVRVGLHVARGVLFVFMLWAFVYSVRILSLADAYAIFLCAPLLITALSWPVLGERVSPARWFAIIVGLMGVLLMLRPSGENLVTLGGLAALCATAGYAVGAMCIRILSRTDSGSATVFWSLAVMTVIAALLSWPQWQPLRLEHWPWILAIAIAGTLGQQLITDAFRRASPSVVAPFEYTSLLWGVALDWVLWSVLPDSRMYVGASIVTVSGLYLMWRERRDRIPAVIPGA
ncbi:MAG: DMT family transporter [Steroidobacteraceae bacterium]